MTGWGIPRPSDWLPEAASSGAEHFDALFDGVFVVCGAVFVATVLGGALLSWRDDWRGVLRWRALVVSIGAAVSLASAPVVVGALDARGRLRTSPRKAIKVRVRPASFRGCGWEFEQPGGWFSDDLLISLKQPVELVFARHQPLERRSDLVYVGEPSRSFLLAIPAMRLVHRASLEGETRVWIRADRAGRHIILSNDHCFAFVQSEVIAMPADEYVRQYPRRHRSGCRGPPYMTTIEWGAQLFRSFGCVACHHHHEGAGRLVGPNLWGVAGTLRPIEGEGEVRADFAYLEESIRRPSVRLAEGYRDQMVSYRNMTDPQLEALVDYLSTLGPDVSRETLAESKARAFARFQLRGGDDKCGWPNGLSW